MTVSQSASSSVDTVVSYSVAGTATSGTDYTALSGTITIPAGSTEATITIDVLDDGLFEGDETVEITLSSITSGLASLGTNISATNTIADNESAPSMTVTKVADVTSNVTVGQTITYTYVVTNTGGVVLSNISLTDTHNASGAPPVPRNEVLTADNGAIGDSSDETPDNGVWDALAPGDVVTFTAQYVVTQSDVDNLQ